jgi:hypothetical protein
MTSAAYDWRASTYGVPRIVSGEAPDSLAKIYEADVNAAIWVRSGGVFDASALTDTSSLSLNISAGLPADAVGDWLAEQLPEGLGSLRADIVELAAMYACLFDTAYLGLRLKTLDAPMCPRFHVDRVTCRLLSTYAGAGTEYLVNEDVGRRRLRGPLGQQYQSLEIGEDAKIHRMPVAAVALCKGEAWPGNEGAGFVHRSPDPAGSPRLVLSIDGLGDEC